MQNGQISTQGAIWHFAFCILHLSMDGLLVINKPSGRSSHDLVYSVRRITGEKRVGHAGTLDPMATGVLVICLGQGVRVSEYLISHDKTYRALIRLGIETDTYDATGQVIATREVPRRARSPRRSPLFICRKDLPKAACAFRRPARRRACLQVGAKKGIALELEPREVEVYSIDLRGERGDEVEIDVHCGKGTFIRSLAHDLGEKLGTGAHLSALTRLASGPFTIEQSLTLEQVEAAAVRGELGRYLLPIDRALYQFDVLNLDNATARDVQQGKFIPMPRNLTTPLVPRMMRVADW